MAFEVHATQGKAGDRGGEVYELIDTERRVRAEVWPQWGFNCLKWQVRGDDDRWRVTDSNGDSDFAFVTGEFNLKKDLPEALSTWPADFRFSVTYRLYADKLRVDARVENLGPGRLPFGLGYHAYFHLPDTNDT